MPGFVLTCACTYILALVEGHYQTHSIPGMMGLLKANIRIPIDSKAWHDTSRTVWDYLLGVAVQSNVSKHEPGHVADALPVCSWQSHDNSHDVYGGRCTSTMC
jgi:hypothetical protein